MEKKRKKSRRVGPTFVVCLLVLALAGVGFVVLRYPVRHLEIIRKYSTQYGFEPAFICAVINAESRFNADAVSGAGAGGLMQLMEDTAIWIAPSAGVSDFSFDQIFDPEVNIRLGCYYLGMYRDRFGSTELALCAYNAGGGRVEGWLADSQISSGGVSLDRIPFEETRLYVERVNNNVKVYEVLLRSFYNE